MDRQSQLRLGFTQVFIFTLKYCLMIHDVGAVTAGIVGTKSYSYHLFGDAVNTASRMCSCSSPGKISLSPSAEETMRLNHPG